MPAQTTINNTKFYTQWDTAPNLADTLYEVDGVTPVNLTGKDVYITIAHVLGSPDRHVTDPIVNHDLCIVVDAEAGKVEWEPKDLTFPGTFYYSFTIWETATGKQQSVKSYAYDYIRVQSPPGGRRPEPWSPPST